jgi:hypothetical protein
MFYTTDPHDRTEFIAALRSLANFLVANPAVPVPPYGADITLCADNYETGGKAQVDHLARLLGASITDNTPDGHYEADRSFGCITYRAVSISGVYTARREAQQSYEKNINVEPDAYELTDCGNPECSRWNPCSTCREAMNTESVHASQNAWWL